MFLVVAGKWLQPRLEVALCAVSGFPGNWLPCGATADAVVTITFKECKYSLGIVICFSMHLSWEKGVLCIRLRSFKLTSAYV